MRGVTLSSILKHKARGVVVNIDPIPKNRVVIPRQDSEPVIWMAWNLMIWCAEKKLRLEKEYQFLPDRKYRADFAIPELKILLEYDGLNSHKSGHTTLLGYTKDTEKFKLAVNAGFKVWRYTILNYRNVLQDLEEVLKK